MYWGMYNDASRAVEEIKRRVPKMVLYRPGAQCTLMANEPTGDIEVIIPPPVSDCSGRYTKRQRPSGEARTSLSPQSLIKTRVRLFRRNRTIEISRYKPASACVDATSPTAGEWVKKVLPAFGQQLRVRQADWEALEACEQEGLVILRYFMRVCEAVDGVPTPQRGEAPDLDVEDLSLRAPSGAVLDVDDATHTVTGMQCHSSFRQDDMPRAVQAGQQGLRPTCSPLSSSATRTMMKTSTPTIRQSQNDEQVPGGPSQQQEPRTCTHTANSINSAVASGSRSIFTAATAATTTLPPLFIVPRPAKFAGAMSGSSMGRPEFRDETSRTSVPAASGTSCGDNRSPLPRSIRYVPNVGWCTKDETTAGLRYTILQPDGTSVELCLTNERGRPGDDTACPDELLQAVRRIFGED
ncbi:hypothetical protein NM688_g8516 [Phlebia brevispora]|uniref:Uncharacterized protein n=1 Tax=Phlebia brevispora TaxID=194682 RepID=A0ACC1RT92_9APHY|nr:hypothetical protein NM688_g8516 [Phlebia brevispora]